MRKRKCQQDEKQYTMLVHNLYFSSKSIRERNAGRCDSSAWARRARGGGEDRLDPYKTLLEGVENLDIIGRSKVMAHPDNSVNW